MCGARRPSSKAEAFDSSPKPPGSGNIKAEQSQHRKLRDFASSDTRTVLKRPVTKLAPCSKARVNGICRALSSRVSQLTPVRDPSKNWRSLCRGFLGPSMSSESEQLVQNFEPHPFRVEQHAGTGTPFPAPIIPSVFEVLPPAHVALRGHICHASGGLELHLVRMLAEVEGARLSPRPLCHCRQISFPI
jgi:hypothetical protein